MLILKWYYLLCNNIKYSPPEWHSRAGVQNGGIFLKKSILVLLLLLKKPMLQNNFSYAVFIGRFQPFHIGHMSVVEKILTQFPRLLLIIGSANESETSKNPWTLEEREEMIRASIPVIMQEKIDIAWLDDVPEDRVWWEKLRNLISNYAGIQANTTNNTQWSCILFTGNEWVADICRDHTITTEWIQYSIDISGSEIREKMRKGEDVSKNVLFDPQNYFI